MSSKVAAERFVTADASPLIGLATANVFYALAPLYGTVTITRAVKDEVMVNDALPGARELDTAMRSGWIRVAPTPPDTWRYPELGAGEASTIALALQHKDSALVLMDDALGVAQARALDLPVLGIADVLAAARSRRLIKDPERIIGQLARRGFIVR